MQWISTRIRKLNSVLIIFNNIAIVLFWNSFQLFTVLNRSKAKQQKDDNLFFLFSFFFFYIRRNPIRREIKEREAEEYLCGRFLWTAWNNIRLFI